MVEEKPCGLMASSHIPVPKPEEINATYCLSLLRRIRDVIFATVDEQGLPSARAIDIMHADDRRLYFLVPRGKAFYEEIVRNPVVAIVGQTTDSRSCRLRGRAVRAKDSEQKRLVDLLFELNPFMSGLYPGKTRYVCEVFYVEEGSGDYFDLGRRPVVRAQFVLGGRESRMGGGYATTDACTGCGACARTCPQNCIVRDENGKATIEQRTCLHCGLCYETCAHNAIRKV